MPERPPVFEPSRLEQLAAAAGVPDSWLRDYLAWSIEQRRAGVDAGRLLGALRRAQERERRAEREPQMKSTS